MGEERKVIISVTENKDFQRFHSNDTYVTVTPKKEIHIDFFEEYVDSISFMERFEEDDDIEVIGVKEDALHVVRQKNVSVSIEKKEAYYLANTILRKLKNDEDFMNSISKEEEEEEVGV